MVNIIFEAHGTTFDNEEHISSGWFDVELSLLGKKQSIEMGKRYKDKAIDLVYCSDLKRSYNSAEIAFGGRDIEIVRDKRLNECNYGDLNHRPSAKVDPLKIKSIEKPFPNGESYLDTAERIKDFLADLLKNHNNETVMIIGHRATQYGLEHWILGKNYKEIISASWSWQPGWEYKFEKL